MLNFYLRAQLAAAGLFAQAQSRLATRRGAGFLEYALLGAVAIVLFVIFRDQLSGVMETLINRVRNAVNGG